MIDHLPPRFAAAAVSQRWTVAIELLGRPSLPDRLAGIYALEALRRESPETSGAVIEVLSSFVRHEAAGSLGTQESRPASTEVQAALAALGRYRDLNLTADRPLDLHGMALRHAYLPLVHFESAFLYDCDLENALLVGAHLEGAWLARTNLRNANLDEAHLEGADLSTARNLLPEQLKTAHLSASTRLPSSFTTSKVSRRPALQLPPEGERTRDHLKYSSEQ